MGKRRRQRPDIDPKAKEKLAKLVRGRAPLDFNRHMALVRAATGQPSRKYWSDKDAKRDQEQV